jgi:hypothetical protein
MPLKVSLVPTTTDGYIAEQAPIAHVLDQNEMWKKPFGGTNHTQRVRGDGEEDVRWCCWPKNEIPNWMNKPVHSKPWCGSFYFTYAIILWLANFAAFLFHAVMVVVVIVLSAGLDNWKTHGGVLLPVYQSKLTFQRHGDGATPNVFSGSNAMMMMPSPPPPRSPAASDWELIPSYEGTEDARGGINLTHFTIYFFALSAFFHLVIVIGSFYHSFYYWWIDGCRQPLRWIEYSLSASLMIVIISFFAGIRDYHVLLCLFFLCFVTICFGWVTEALSRPHRRRSELEGKSAFEREPEKSQWHINANREHTLLLCKSSVLAALQRLGPHLLGWIPFGVVWYIVWDNFTFSVLQSDSERQPPDFVYAIIWGEIFIFSSFAISQLLQQSSDWGCHNYWIFELLYIVLSIVAKGLLGVILLTNILLISGGLDDVLANNNNNNNNGNIGNGDGR